MNPKKRKSSIAFNTKRLINKLMMLLTGIQEIFKTLIFSLIRLNRRKRKWLVLNAT